MDLLLNPEVAEQAAKSLAIFCAGVTGSAIGAAAAYKQLYKIFVELSKLRKEKTNNSLKLDAQQVTEVNHLNGELAKGLGFTSLAELDQHTKDKEETAKLLMAQFRRTKKIVKFVQRGQASFPTDG